MSLTEQKQLDFIYKGVLSLLGVALTVIFYSIWNGQKDLVRITNSLEGRMIKIETKLDDELTARSKDDARRDKTIEELQQAINRLQRK